MCLVIVFVSRDEVGRLKDTSKLTTELTKTITKLEESYKGLGDANIAAILSGDAVAIREINNGLTQGLQLLSRVPKNPTATQEKQITKLRGIVNNYLEAYVKGYETLLPQIEKTNEAETELAKISGVIKVLESLNYSKEELTNFCLLYTSPSPRD